MGVDGAFYEVWATDCTPGRKREAFLVLKAWGQSAEEVHAEHHDAVDEFFREHGMVEGMMTVKSRSRPNDILIERGTPEPAEDPGLCLVPPHSLPGIIFIDEATGAEAAKAFRKLMSDTISAAVTKLARFEGIDGRPARDGYDSSGMPFDGQS